jgi:hypothetical protein
VTTEVTHPQNMDETQSEDLSDEHLNPFQEISVMNTFGSQILIKAANHYRINGESKLITKFLYV